MDTTKDQKLSQTIQAIKTRTKPVFGGFTSDDLLLGARPKNPFSAGDDPTVESK